MDARLRKLMDGAVLVERKCGGWLATTGQDAEIRIGATADTEEGALDGLRERAQKYLRYRDHPARDGLCATAA